jgi:hypothetical protein
MKRKHRPTRFRRVPAEARQRFLPLSPCGRGCLSEAKAGEGLVPYMPLPLTRLHLATLDFATLSHKGRGEEGVHSPRRLKEKECLI